MKFSELRQANTLVMSKPARRQVFLFLQGPLSPFFSRLANALEAHGHRTLRINVCVADWLLWRRPGAVNFRGSPDAWPDYVAAFLDREGVTDLVLLGEQRFYQKAAIAAARTRGIAVTVTDFGYLRPDWITLEPDGMSGWSRFPRNTAAIRALAKGAPEPSLEAKYTESFFWQAVWNTVFDLANTLSLILFPHYVSYHLHSPILSYPSTGLRMAMSRLRRDRVTQLIDGLRASSTPYYLFPMQMENDFQLRAYSPYPDMVAALRDVVGSFAKHAASDARLVIKVHPFDAGLRNWRRIVYRMAKTLGVAERVYYVDGGSLGDMLAGTKGVVTINSTVGVWALRANRPVIALGTAIYDVDGLTFQGTLNQFWKNAREPDAELTSDFVTALAHTIQIRGLYYTRPGLDSAVSAAARKLDRSTVEIEQILVTPRPDRRRAPKPLRVTGAADATAATSFFAHEADPMQDRIG